jgi:hypothetical protein
MGFAMRLFAALLGIGSAATLAAVSADAAPTPKRGGILTYMIPADAPPSLDGHRETHYILPINLIIAA